MFKVLTGSAEVGGTLARQKELVALAAQSLEAKLNAGGVQEVLAGGAYESEHEVVLFSIVKFEEPKKKPSAKKEK